MSDNAERWDQDNGALSFFRHNETSAASPGFSPHQLLGRVSLLHQEADASDPTGVDPMTVLLSAQIIDEMVANTEAAIAAVARGEKFEFE